MIFVVVYIGNLNKMKEDIASTNEGIR